MLLERIEEDLLRALKAHEVGRVSVLRTLKATLQNAAIAARTSAKQILDDADVVQVIHQEVKRLRDALSDFTRAARTDLIAAANSELEILHHYLPEQMSLADVRLAVRTIVDDMRSKGVTDFPQVMRAAMAELKGKADGNEIANAIREALADTNINTT